MYNERVVTIAYDRIECNVCPSPPHYHLRFPVTFRCSGAISQIKAWRLNHTISYSTIVSTNAKCCPAAFK